MVESEENKGIEWRGSSFEYSHHILPSLLDYLIELGAFLFLQKAYNLQI